MSVDDEIALPLSLRHAIETGNAVLFSGAGIGNNALDSKGQAGPSGKELASELCERFSIDAPEADLEQVAQLVEIRKGRAELVAFLVERFAELEPDENLQWLLSLPWKAIFTTNYDRLIERTFEVGPTVSRKPVSIATTSQVVPTNFLFEVPVFHLHGFLFDGPSEILITENDYALFREPRRMLFEILKERLATSTILYVGYSQRDPNWKMVLAELQAEFSPSSPPGGFRVAPNTPAVEAEILRSRGIETIGLDLTGWVGKARAAIGEIPSDPMSLEALRKDVPALLQEPFESAPAAVARLLSSWSLVNAAPFDEESNIQGFLAGDLPNWGLVARSHHFERDIRAHVVDELFDFATDPASKPRILMVHAPAGYGVTTLLMDLAAQLVREQAGSVFFHKRTASLQLGDIEFSAKSIDGAKFYFVDNAADHVRQLAPIVQRLREGQLNACLVLGERTNEWRQARSRVHPKEYALEPLSEDEIDRLLDCLETHNSLGRLKDLDLSLRRATIREKHQKELLVAMKEATEGKAFNAIIEDEFQGISDDFSKQIYRVVCAFYRTRALARDLLLSDVLEVPLADLYLRSADHTEGVIRYECIDEVEQSYAARARHSTIAEIVWDRCIESGERERILQVAMEHLNLTHQVDRVAFESFVRSDDAVDGIGSLESKIRFFETAMKKDPRNPYVRQHFARMLRRDGRGEMALAEIDRALKMDPEARVLHHTRGVILTDLALEADSPEIGRRRLVQSEDAFRKQLKIYNRDEYAFQGLARLYLGWARRTVNEEDAVTYVAKAEEVISEGLRIVSDRESLWIVSAEVQEFLGDRPQAINILERAVSEASPGSIVGRYLLARAYRRGGEFQRSVEILKPVIEQNPEEFRSVVVYAQCLHELGEPYPKCIAVLELASSTGFRDPRYVATLGGMNFMHGQFTEAEKIFEESRTRGFSWSESTRIEFVPADASTGQRLRMEGVIVSVQAGFAFIRAPGYSDFFCSRSKYGNVLMEKGKKVSFAPAFSARGATALDPVEI